MTIQEIRDLVAKKISGQGTQVDVGGGLATILNAICDALATIPDAPVTLEIASTAISFSNKTKAEAIECLGITGEELDALFAGKVDILKRGGFKYRLSWNNYESNLKQVFYGAGDVDALETIYIDCDKGSYTFRISEI